MITVDYLGEKIKEHQKHKKEFKFYADHYMVSIKFINKIYISTSLENLSAYSSIEDKNQRLIHYIKQNTYAIGYVHSSLAYNKNSEVIVQQWLEYNTNIEQILTHIDYLLRHADLLTNKHYIG